DLKAEVGGGGTRVVGGGWSVVGRDPTRSANGPGSQNHATRSPRRCADPRGVWGVVPQPERSEGVASGGWWVVGRTRHDPPTTPVLRLARPRATGKYADPRGVWGVVPHPSGAREIKNGAVRGRPVAGGRRRRPPRESPRG